MQYIYQILAVILIGISVGAVLSRRNLLLTAGSLVAVALGIVTLFAPSWLPLAIGVAVYLLAQVTQRDPEPGTRYQS